jgi:hypothetical protein
MKFKAKKLEVKKLYNGNTEFSLEVEDKQNRLISQINDHKQLLSSEVEVAIDKYRKKRSGGHNRLFWDMCGELAEHINDALITQLSIYRDLIREYGVSTIYPVKDEDLKFITRDWESRGDGWITQELRKSTVDKNYTTVKFWFGSSIYDSKQFWRLVEGLKAMCKDYNLDISHYDQPMQLALNEFEQKEKATYGND